ncbi:MAG: hypothetical protein LRY39_00505 [Alphaproteobacteria bacterium]|nr:hypothetical protein [Alphaproteobacteria bacterium]
MEILRSFGSSDKWNKLERELPLKPAGTAVSIYKGELTGYVMANKAAKEELHKFGSHTVWEHFRRHVETAHLRDQSPAPGL